uniref:Uncharacterized protein n=1 Tax=Anguilla anguilla TaxID=7936 RepID=A0A0E9R8L4_ANGAN
MEINTFNHLLVPFGKYRINFAGYIVSKFSCLVATYPTRWLW